ncbi:MAG: hypothetical protein RIR70_799 [Pseudomonadota bacterium]
MASRASLKLLRLARDNDSTAQLELGKLYLAGGEGIAPNQEAALIWLGRAADQGLREASRLIARHIPPPCVPDAEGLLPHYEAAANAGDALAALHAAMVWQARQGPVSRDRARYFFEIAAQGGNSEAQVLLARILEQTGQRTEPAVRQLLSKAADAGSDEALRALAERAWVKRDLQGLTAVRALANHDEPTWWYRLGVLLRLQADDIGSCKEGSEWISRASEAGYPAAQFEYGAMLAGFMPADMRRNYKRAARLLEAALENGVAEAGVALARLHDNPRFEGRDATHAQEMLHRSARAGLPEAQVELARRLMKPLRRNGKRDAASLLECARWLDQALRGGHPDAQALLDDITDSPPRQEAESLAYQAQIIGALAAQHPSLAQRFKLMAALGLSKAEMLLFDPAHNDHGFCVLLAAEGKSSRLVRIIDDAQRALIDESKRLLSPAPNAEPPLPYAAQYRKLMTIAKRYAINWAHFGDR